MTDNELLELAAKAAGIEVVWLESSYYGPTMARVDFKSMEGEITEPWNPLTDDGDALRLAVRLELHPKVDYTNGVVFCEFTKNGDEVTEALLDDPYLATRRAIVRAAAEIGQQ